VVGARCADGVDFASGLHEPLCKEYGYGCTCWSSIVCSHQRLRYYVYALKRISSARWKRSRAESYYWPLTGVWYNGRRSRDARAAELAL